MMTPPEDADGIELTIQLKLAEKNGNKPISSTYEVNVKVLQQDFDAFIPNFNKTEEQQQPLIEVEE